MMLGRSFAVRLSAALALLLLAYGAFVALLGRQVATEHERESLQRLSHGLAQHIVGHWPEITAPDRETADRAARQALLNMLMVVNPGVQVYVLDADGRVNAYVGEPGMVRQHQVDLDPVRQFLAGAPLPLVGTDPMGSGQLRIFSAAMFPPRPGDTRPPGYLYVVLDGNAREQIEAQVTRRRVWQGAAVAAAIGLLVTLLVGGVALQRLTRPLHRLARRMGTYQLGNAGGRAAGVAAGPASPPSPARTNEVQAISDAFDDLTARLESQTTRERELAAAHRETMAGVAHDLRTPLTALHGHLEALAGTIATMPPRGRRCCARRWRRVTRYAASRNNCSSWPPCSPASDCRSANVSGSTSW
jgi:His Kinase A (phospho-acceptor) domain